eukprot:UN13981
MTPISLILRKHQT